MPKKIVVILDSESGYDYGRMQLLVKTLEGGKINNQIYGFDAYRKANMNLNDLLIDLPGNINVIIAGDETTAENTKNFLRAGRPNIQVICLNDDGKVQLLTKSDDELNQLGET